MNDTRDRLIAAGIEPAGSASPEEFATFIRSQADVRGKIIKSIGMKVDQ